MKAKPNFLNTSLCVLLSFACAGCTQTDFDAVDPKTREEHRANAQNVRTMITASPAIELVSVDPFAAPIEGGNLVYGFNATGRSSTSDRSEISRIAAALEKSIAEGDASALCFTPRHAIKVTHPDGSTSTLAICFLCRNARFIGPSNWSSFFPLTRDAETVLDEIFQQHGLKKAPLPKMPDDSSSARK